MSIMDVIAQGVKMLKERGLQIKAFGKTQVLRVQPEELQPEKHDNGIDLADAIALRLPIPSYDGVLHRYRRSNYPARLGIKSKELFWRAMYEQNGRIDRLCDKVIKEAAEAAPLILSNDLHLTRNADRAWAIVLHRYVHRYGGFRYKLTMPEIAILVGLTLRQLYVVMWALSIPTREKAPPLKVELLDSQPKVKKAKKRASRRPSGYVIYANDHEGLGERYIGEEIMR